MITDYIYTIIENNISIFVSKFDTENLITGEILNFVIKNSVDLDRNLNTDIEIIITPKRWKYSKEWLNINK